MKKCLLAAGLAFAALVGRTAESVVQKVRPGETYQIDCSWRIIDVVRTSWTHPQLEAFDADGKRIFFRWDAGNFWHRTFDPSDAYVEKWRFYVRVKDPAGAAIPATRFSMGLQTIEIPSESDRFELKIVTAGDPAQHAETTLLVTKLAAPVPVPQEVMPPFETPARLLSDAELDARLAALPRKRAELRTTGSRTTMFVDGKPVVPRIWKGGSRGEWEAVEQFGKCGFNIFKVQVELREIWHRDGTLDVSPVRERLRKCLKVNPEAMLLFQFSIRPRPFWGVDNPDEVYQDSRGRFGVFQNVRLVDFTPQPIDEGRRYAAFSYMSAKFAQEVSELLSRAFAEFETWPESKNVVAVYVTGGADNQWLDLFDAGGGFSNAADYSPAGKKCYRHYLRRKYQTVEAMNAAWGGTGFASFDEIETPSDEAFNMREKTYFRLHGATPESDWRECWAQATVGMRLKFAKAIKNATGRRMLVGAYSPNGALEGYPIISQTASRRLIESPDYDFFSVVPWYMREFSEPIRAAAFTGSFARHAKLYISELDLRNAEVSTWGLWGSPFWRENHNADTFRRKAIYYVADAFVRGGSYHACDMGGHYFNTPAAMETWTRVNRIADRVRPLPWTGDHVAVVGGERYWDHQSLGMSRVLPYYVREVGEYLFAYSGLPHANYLLEEILDDPRAELPKMVVFNDLTTVTPEEFRELRRRYAKDGRVLVYSWRLGLFAPGGETIEKELGLEPCPSSFRGRMVHADGTSSDPLMKGVAGLFNFGKYYLGDDYAEKLSPRGKGWRTLATFDGSDVPAVAVRRAGGCTEVYVSAPNQMPQRFCRNLSREAGFEPTVETDDLSGFGSGIFYLLAQTDGVKRFKLPRTCRAGEVLEGPTYETVGESCEVPMKRGEIFVLEVKDR